VREKKKGEKMSESIASSSSAFHFCRTGRGKKKGGKKVVERANRIPGKRGEGRDKEGKKLFHATEEHFVSFVADSRLLWKKRKRREEGCHFAFGGKGGEKKKKGRGYPSIL